jgi:creatinine amidohydrolase/Fe(II)-dependent formamide hydrolase-like protein
VNGQPTLASIEEGNAAREKIVEALTAKVQAIIQQESGA